LHEWGVNHCLLEVDVLEAPQVRYTQDNQMPIAEMAVRFDGLRPDEPPGQLKVVGLGNLAQDLQNRVQVGQRLVIEGRLRINTVTRKDGIKEKRAEFTLSRLHPLAAADATAPAAAAPAAPQGSLANSAYGTAPAPGPGRASFAPRSEPAAPAPVQAPTWNTSPLVPDLPEGDDDIPF
jgi:single-stranded DNA-binding protein